jgi:shikimate kinase
MKPPLDDATPTSLVLTRPLVLVGLMGAGKTTVGRRIARKLRLGFYDADDEIEKAATISISEIFTEYGEEEFRALERRVIARILEEEKPSVIATGGGAFMNPQTRKLIKEKAVSVWLKADIDVLLDRVTRRDTRPLLRNTDPRAVMERLLRQRAPAYSQADIHIASDKGPHRNTVDKIIAALMERPS